MVGSFSVNGWWDRVLLFEGIIWEMGGQKDVAFCGLEFGFVFLTTLSGKGACESPHVNTDLQSPYPSTR